MKKILLLSCVLFFARTVYSQNCCTEAERYRIENNELTQSNNEQTLTISRLRSQLSVKQDSIILLTRKIIEVERQSASLRVQIHNLQRNLQAKDLQIGANRNEIENLKNQLRDLSNLTTAEQLELRRRLDRVQNSLNDALSGREKDSQANLMLASQLEQKSLLAENYEADMKERESQNRDYIHIKDETIHFKDKLFDYEQTLFILHFKENDEVFNPDTQERVNIKRLVELVSKYDNKAKIQLDLGSIENDRIRLERREDAIKRYILTKFSSPFNLSERNLSRRTRSNSSSYNVEVSVVKR